MLAELGLTAEDIKQTHQWLAVQAITHDPLKYFHDLFRMAPYRERAKLKNEARRAQDAFDAGEMLRRFHHDLTGELLPAPDEIIDGTEAVGRNNSTVTARGSATTEMTSRSRFGFITSIRMSCI